MCGVCRLCADILCPLRLLWFLYPVHWGSALPLPGGHPAVLCWHGIILWLWARSVEPNWSPGGNIFRPQCSGLCGPGLLVSDTYSLSHLSELWCFLSRFPVWAGLSLCLSIEYFQYVIYGLASFFFLYGIFLLAEGFYATSAVKQSFGEFRSTQCGRCLSLTVSTRGRGGVSKREGGHDITVTLEWFSMKSSWVYGVSRESWLTIHGLFSGPAFITLKPFSCAAFKWPNKVCPVFLQFIIVTYILAFIWLAVFAFSAIPVFFLFNMEQTCHNINILAETTPSINQHGWICMDARQYGALLS